LTAAVLVKLGVPSEAVIPVPPVFGATRDRTYSSALALRNWLERSNPRVRSVNLFSMGPHSRRSWLLFQKALEPKVQVGIIAAPDISYNPQRWWATSNGFRGVLSEAIAYL